MKRTEYSCARCGTEGPLWQREGRKKVRAFFEHIEGWLCRTCHFVKWYVDEKDDYQTA